MIEIGGEGVHSCFAHATLRALVHVAHTSGPIQHDWVLVVGSRVVAVEAGTLQVGLHKLQL
eukprot:784168-Pleurochrysis_carterae.AAC.1